MSVVRLHPLALIKESIMKKQNPRMYGFYNDITKMYNMGLCSFRTYLYYRALYNDSIRPVPKKTKK